MRKKLLALLLTSCCFLFSGCNFMLPNVEELLQPPTLSEEQSAILEALQNSGLGENIQLKYPKNGEYRSAFVRHDLDGDGFAEALVFYQDPSNESRARIGILDYREDLGWERVFDYPGSNSEIDQIQFVNITNQPNSSDLVIGWASASPRESKTLSLYHYQDRRLKVLAQESYDELAIVNFHNPGYDDIVLLEHSYNGQELIAKLLTLTEDGTIGLVGEDYRLPYSYTEYVQITSGKLSDGNSALFIDGYLNDSILCTSVIYYDFAAEQLSSPLLFRNEEEVDDYTESTLRTAQVYSRDINGDGVMEIPIRSYVSVPGYEQQEDLDGIYYYEFVSITPEGLSRSPLYFVNSEQRYMIRLPDEWGGRVTLTQTPRSNEWRLWVYNGSLNNLTEELLRIKTYSQNDYHDKLELESYQLIASNGLTEYYAYIPPSQNQEYYFTYEIIEKEIFMML